MKSERDQPRSLFVFRNSMNRFLPFALLVCFSATSRACLNDRDSDALAVQNKRFPDALRVISGRFERNPPRFYGMRIERVQAELKAHPRDFGLYDDLAVAHDKLGDDEAALKVMARKRALLPVFNAKDKANKEAWYRYFANDGTFRAHRFLHDGAQASRIGEMKAAREEIKRALQIKPNAHFGREKYQLAVMDWVVATKLKKREDALADFLSERFRFDDGYDMPRHPLDHNRREAAQGLSGLIVLGAAWQSPDVFDALATALESRPTIALSYLARHRSQELLQNGAHSLQPKAVLPLYEYWLRDRMGRGLNDENAGTLDAFYPKLRAEAEDWNTSRTKWMEDRFARGQHSDTDANFWKGWKETAAPTLQVAWFNEKQDRQQHINARRAATTRALALIFGALALSLLVLKRKRRAHRHTSLA